MCNNAAVSLRQAFVSDSYAVINARSITPHLLQPQQQVNGH